jgi:N utilization substance protein B
MKNLLGCYVVTSNNGVYAILFGMALPPQKFREIVFQVLFSSDLGCDEKEETISFLMHELKVTRRSMLEVYERIGAIRSKQEEIDALITESSKEYQFERISSVEKNILRACLFEIQFCDTVPKKVVIAESIRLTRKFGTPESARFVNAIMDAIYTCKYKPTAV